MTLLAALVEASQRVGATGSRLSKVRELAALLRALAPDEVGISTLYLSGETPQGSIGLGYATLQEAAASAPAARASLSVADVDQALHGLAQLRGAGSAARRSAALRELFARATSAEQQFLGRLLSGELRQGALTGVMLEAIAAAAQLPVQHVRRAAMYSKHLGAVAAAALLEGETALDQFQLQLFSPVAPMLAQTAADVGAALQELPGEVAFEWKMDGARIQVHKQASDGAHLHTGAERRHRGRAGNRRTRAHLPGAGADPGRRGHRPATRRSGRCRFRSRCAASGASCEWRRCARSCRCRHSSSIACVARGAASWIARRTSASRPWLRPCRRPVRVPRLVTASAEAARGVLRGRARGRS